MKRVSFKVAKAIKEAGYPQYGRCDEYYNQEGRIVDKFCNLDKLIYPAPTYLEVWLWLWRDKHIALEVFVTSYDKWAAPIDILLWYKEYSDPEKAIIAAIEYLVDNDLIK